MEDIRILHHVGAPAILIAIVGVLQGIGLAAWVDSMETFAGQHEVTKAMRRAGFSAIALELLFDDAMDILTPAGFLNHVACALMLKPGAFSINAPVCSSWALIADITVACQCCSQL